MHSFKAGGGRGEGGANSNQNRFMHALFRLCFVTLRSDLSFDFHLTFLQLNEIKIITLQ